MSDNVKVDNKVALSGTELALEMVLAGLRTSPVMATLGSGLTIEQVARTFADLMKKAEEYAKAFREAREAKGVARDKIAARRKVAKDAAEFVSELRSALTTAIGKGSSELEKFGIKPKSPKRELTAEEKAKRAEKARLTRELRHTMGPRQKAAIKAGNLPATPNGAAPTTGTTPANGTTPVAPPGGTRSP